jgi:hypothetical protein
VSGGVDGNAGGSGGATTSYGPIVRKVTERGHVYRTAFSWQRWLAIGGGVVGIALAGWLLHHLQDRVFDRMPVIRQVGVPLVGVMGTAIAALAFVGVYARARLDISPGGVILRRRGLLFGRGPTRTCRIDELAGAVIADMRQYYVGGSASSFHLELLFPHGERERFGGAFDDARSAKRAAEAIGESVRLMRGAG